MSSWALMQQTLQAFTFKFYAPVRGYPQRTLLDSSCCRTPRCNLRHDTATALHSKGKIVWCMESSSLPKSPESLSMLCSDAKPASGHICHHWSSHVLYRNCGAGVNPSSVSKVAGAGSSCFLLPPNQPPNNPPEPSDSALPCDAERSASSDGCVGAPA